MRRQAHHARAPLSWTVAIVVVMLGTPSFARSAVPHSVSAIDALGTPATLDAAHGAPIYLLDAAGRRRWQVVPAEDSMGCHRAFSVHETLGGLDVRAVEGDAPHLLDLDEVLLEVRRASIPAVADFDGDGRSDVAVLSEVVDLGSGGSNRFQVAILLSTSMPRGVVGLRDEAPDASILGRRTSMGGGTQYEWILPGDFNGDGHVDLVVGYQRPTRLHVHEIHLGPFASGDHRDMETREPHCVLGPVSRNNLSPAVGDVNGDGYDDIVISDDVAPTGAPWDFELVVVFGGAALPATIDLFDPATPHVARLLTEPDELISRELVVLDFDGDGLSEVAMHGITDSGFGGLLIFDQPLRRAGRHPLFEPLPAVLGFNIRVKGSVKGNCSLGDALVTDAYEWNDPESGVIVNGLVALVDPRPRAFWDGAEPDVVVVGPPKPPSAPDRWPISLFVDLNDDGFRDIAIGHDEAYDASMDTAGGGVLLLASLGPVMPPIVRIAESFSQEIRAGSQESNLNEHGKGPLAGDFDGDGIQDLVVTGSHSGPAYGFVRVLRGQRTPEPVDAAGCDEIHFLRPGSSADTVLPDARGPVVAWGSVARGADAFDPLQQTAPVVQRGLVGDPVIHVDGTPLGDLVRPSNATAVPYHRGILDGIAPGSVRLDVPFDSAATGAHHVCLHARNRAPLSAAGSDQRLLTAPDATSCEIDVRLAGAVHDLDCDAVTARWELEGVVLASTTDTTLSLPVGTHRLVLRATDAFSSGTDELLVEVVDATPPRLDVRLADMFAWPPNHRLVELRLATDVLFSATDNCDPAPAVRFVAASSSERDDARGSGNTRDDIVVEDERVLIRRERSGNGPGRSYVLVLEATDVAGNATRAEVSVEIAHDNRNASPRQARRRP